MDGDSETGDILKKDSNKNFLREVKHEVGMD
jgi:hypothetical protein